MRFNSRYSLMSREGETRIHRKFLLMPRQFDEGKWRWLEYADIIERVCKVDSGGSMVWGAWSWKWCEVRFADEELT